MSIQESLTKVGKALYYQRAQDWAEVNEENIKTASFVMGILSIIVGIALIWGGIVGLSSLSEKCLGDQLILGALSTLSILFGLRMMYVGLYLDKKLEKQKEKSLQDRDETLVATLGQDLGGRVSRILNKTPPAPRLFPSAPLR